MTRAIVAIFALAIVAIGAVYGLQVALADAGDETIITNETWTPSAGSVTQLDNSGQTGAYYDNETTVYDENDTLQERGTDYEWFPNNGTVKALGGGGLDGDSEATISYEYQQTTKEQRQFAALLAQAPSALMVAFPMFLLVIGLIILRG